MSRLLFQVYPYVCFVVFIVGSLIRFDQAQYSWKSDSSQMLRTGTLRWGSNLSHRNPVSVLRPPDRAVYAARGLRLLHECGAKQVLAVTAGGIAGFICFIGLTLLLHRRLFDPRIRYTGHFADIAVLVVLWIQLVVGLITLPYSWQHADGSVMLVLADWAQRIVTLRPVDATALAQLPWPFLFTSCSA